MLDRTSKHVIAYIRAMKDATWRRNQGYCLPSVPYDEFIKCLDFLEEEKYLTVERVSGGVISATLTHRGLHAKEFDMIWIKRYMLDIWVSVLALIVSIIALVVSSCSMK